LQVSLYFYSSLTPIVSNDFLIIDYISFTDSIFSFILKATLKIQEAKREEGSCMKL
jgi:hypothetical protein